VRTGHLGACCIPMVAGMAAVTLPPELEEFAAGAVACGSFCDVYEVVQPGVSLVRRIDIVIGERRLGQLVAHFQVPTLQTTG
jgi:hypothetical protein